MKNVTIRKGFFETASSSVHTFTIGGGRWDDNKIKEELSAISDFAGMVCFEGGQFGWGFATILTDIKFKFQS